MSEKWLLYIVEVIIGQSAEAKVSVLKERGIWPTTYLERFSGGRCRDLGFIIWQVAISIRRRRTMLQPEMQWACSLFAWSKGRWTMETSGLDSYLHFSFRYAQLLACLMCTTPGLGRLHWNSWYSCSLQLIGSYLIPIEDPSWSTWPPLERSTIERRNVESWSVDVL